MIRNNLAALKRLKKCVCVRKFKGENVEKMRTRLKKEIVEKFGDYALSELIENKDSFEFRTNFILKPKMEKDTPGIIEFRSNDYIFHAENGDSSYGPALNLENIHITHYGFYIVAMGNAKVEYYLY